MSSTLKFPWATGDGDGSGSSTANGWVLQLGVVAAVDRDKGEITLVPRKGMPSCLTAHPSLLKDVRRWGVVHVLTDGTVIRRLRCL
jgi:hypothetical protein